MMRRRVSTVLILVVMMVASASVAYGAAAKADFRPSGMTNVFDTTQSSRDTARFVLTRPLTVAQVAAKLRGLDADRVELIQRDVVNGVVYTSGVVIYGGVLSPDLYANELASTFADMATEFAQSASSTVSDRAEMLAMADAMESAAKSVAATNASIEAIVVTASDETLRALADWELVGASTIIISPRTSTSARRIPRHRFLGR